jgi:hypothetical protein
MISPEPSQPTRMSTKIVPARRATSSSASRMSGRWAPTRSTCAPSGEKRAAHQRHRRHGDQRDDVGLRQRGVEMGEKLVNTELLIIATISLFAGFLIFT